MTLKRNLLALAVASILVGIAHSATAADAPAQDQATAAPDTTDEAPRLRGFSFDPFGVICTRRQSRGAHGLCASSSPSERSSSTPGGSAAMASA